MDINDEWKMFLKTNNESFKEETTDNTINGKCCEFKQIAPIPSPIYISTKTNIAFLKKQNNIQNDKNNDNNDKKEVDILSVFWNVPIISYIKPVNGIVKKQILIKSVNEEELNKIKDKMLNMKDHCEEFIIKSINNPNGRVKFKDIRKISIGMCKKDIISFRCKKKSAFDNCVVFIMRLNIKGIFKEYHIKLFNTGKIEIPGVKDHDIFIMIIDNLIKMLNPYIDLYLLPLVDNNMEVLINSNFNCGFYIKRDVLYKILKYEYNIPTIYDPCMYPGIQCKYNYEIKNDDGTLTYKKVSFMIFRTGSVLIMGKCKEYILHEMYEYVSNLLIEKYDQISQGNNNKEVDEDIDEDIDENKKSTAEDQFKIKSKPRKNKKKIVIMNNQNKTK